MTFIDSLIAHRDRQTAILAVNFYNFETLTAVLRAASRAGAEVILQTSPSTLDYLRGPRLAVAMARAAAEQEGVRAWLQLDHATNLDIFKACVDCGYDSAMIDASEREIPENIRVTREAVQYAHRANVAVEAELGFIPKLGQSSSDDAGFTQPHQAKTFVEETGVDLLAVAIGTAHGFYKQTPRLDFDRLTAIRSAVNVPLVLHGGSGLGAEVWAKAIRRGITKINLATEVKDTFMRTLRAGSDSKEIDLRKVFLPPIAAVSELLSHKFQICRGATFASPSGPRPSTGLPPETQNIHDGTAEKTNVSCSQKRLMN